MIYEDTDSKKTYQITKDVLLISIYGEWNPSNISEKSLRQKSNYKNTDLIKY